MPATLTSVSARALIALWIGQSNLGAQGGLTGPETVPARGEKIARTFMFRNYGSGLEELVIGENTAQLPYEIDVNDHRFGPEVGFSQRDRTINAGKDRLNLKHSLGGTSLVTNKDGDPKLTWNPFVTDVQTLWIDALDDLRNLIEIAGPGAYFDTLAILSQEADRTPTSGHPAVARSIREMIRQVRGIVGHDQFRTVMPLLRQKDTDPPEMVDETNSYRAMQADLVSDSPLNFRTYNIDDLTILEGDSQGVHLDGPSLITSGQRAHQTSMAD
ncbi:hypothetical protein [Hansschlegelia zhihuaiae]|uniref:Uncharacterized protein n=1 Tax=Hansschlegelia zhihuaiae TaxID=405005 RepID=A0A4V1KIW7_9HYPH|nr:hypothetical protein [Hansschlegelia zhihuaiae]RXF72132.1 hypothetical protein EK403_15090 [Hansschlegelia zhihuaiae]